MNLAEIKNESKKLDLYFLKKDELMNDSKKYSPPCDKNSDAVMNILNELSLATAANISKITSFDKSMVSRCLIHLNNQNKIELHGIVKHGRTRSKIWTPKKEGC